MGYFLICSGIILIIWFLVQSIKNENERKHRKAIDETAQYVRRARISFLEKLKNEYIDFGYKGDLYSLSSNELEYYYIKGVKLKKEREQILKGLLINPKNRLSPPIKQSTSIPKNIKTDWMEFKAYLEQYGITYFYHFTDKSNLTSIKKYGGLFSWKYCNENNIDIPRAGGDALSRDLDVRYNLEDYVRLSFCKDHPMAYRLNMKGYNLVLLKIKIDVAWLNDTLFSNMNATDSSHSHGSTLLDLKRVDIKATQEQYVSNIAPNFKLHQAEVLVKRHIPIEYIENIDNPIHL